MSPAIGTAHARANYLEGDPAQPESILGGRLDCEPGGLRFSSTERELLLGLDDLLGISITGRSPAKEGGRNEFRGTMRVAGLEGGEPAEWVFAVDRSDAAEIQRRLNSELAARGRPALPHIEELIGFPINGGSPPPREVLDPTPLDLVAAELGHRLDGVDRAPSNRRRWAFWIALAAIALALEIAIPLILLR
jgi:hypothetical protein